MNSWGRWAGGLGIALLGAIALPSLAVVSPRAPGSPPKFFLCQAGQTRLATLQTPSYNLNLCADGEGSQATHLALRQRSAAGAAPRVLAIVEQRDDHYFVAVGDRHTYRLDLAAGQLWVEFERRPPLVEPIVAAD